MTVREALETMVARENALIEGGTEDVDLALVGLDLDLDEMADAYDAIWGEAPTAHTDALVGFLAGVLYERARA